MAAHYVFAYGSLVGTPAAVSARPAALAGHRRSWRVAMDNTADLPGYKHYLDPATGERPAICVAFLDLEPVAGSTVNGMLLEVDRAALAGLDRRERNYARREITAELDLPSSARAWTYVGTPEARARFRRGHAAGRAVVRAEYHEAVRDAFRALGPEHERHFEASTVAPACPVRPLARVDHAD